ncbi:MAG: UDP-N-acetylmuramoyl-L-alanine--D-glutamate ligase [Candidatus Pelagadaptatus aseana]|uniref:UDP-N-acetylmuramoyl-L-alanine--D-glutamate ligase n=1 Tax=Candidatus Pelagadaptatus aseana TaxID=3120508 RepID=UPI0039B349BE
MDMIATNKVTAIVGMGVTGRSVARYLSSQGEAFVWLDTREQPPALQDILQEYPNLNYELGELNPETLCAVKEIVLSPGICPELPALLQAREEGVSLVGDIELFLRQVTEPVIAITGSNAKSTVTTLVGEMAKAAGKQVGVGGNIGVPVLDLLEQPNDLYVLELSSFQLETIDNLGAAVATVLNVSEDHMDRYDSLMHYHRAKQKIYFGAKKVVVNRADPLTNPPLAEGVERLSFGLNAPDRHGFGLLNKGGQEWLAFEFKALMPASEVRMPGRHSLDNALAALALGHAAGLEMQPMLDTLKAFKGLPHRCEWVAEANGINYYNDSKGTNVGATLAALNGLAKASGKIVLIAGGVGKGADFSGLRGPLQQCRGLVLIGEDAGLIEAAVSGAVPIVHGVDMADAVVKAQAMAQVDDDILLSPACASFDMFSGFEARGEAFVAAVREAIS